MSTSHDLAGEPSPSTAEEAGRVGRRTAPRPAAPITADQVRMIEARSTLTMDQAMVVTDRSRETLRKAIRAGHLRASKWGSRVVIRRSDLDAYMDALPSARARGAA